MSFKITTLTAFISVDEDGEEGLIGLPIGDGMLSLPAIAADKTRVDELYPQVKAFSKMFGFKFKVIELSVRKDITEQFTS